MQYSISNFLGSSLIPEISSYIILYPRFPDIYWGLDYTFYFIYDKIYLSIGIIHIYFLLIIVVERLSFYS